MKKQFAFRKKLSHPALLILGMIMIFFRLSLEAQHELHSAIQQTALEHHECGTTTSHEEAQHYLEHVHPHFINFRKQFKQHDPKAKSTMLVAPVQLHILRNSDGTGGIDPALVYQEFEDYVRPAFAGAGLDFTICGVNYINGPAIIGSYGTADNLSLIHSVPNKVNIYFGDVTPTFNRDGFAYLPSGLPNDYLFVRNGVVGNGSTTAHELGHYFGLYHTHETEFGKECPDGSNCSTAGDLMCDTPADPNLTSLALGYLVDEQCEFNQNWTAGPECNDDPYDPPTRNFMSYSSPSCRTEFTPDQNALMAFVVQTSRAYISYGNCALTTNCPTIIHVKETAAPGGDGASWATAFQDLQDALSFVDECPGITEIWVAAGTYKPTSGTDRTISFTMKNGVAIYGGFPNTGNPGFSSRDWSAYPTILSGDIGTPGNNGDNSYHVILNSFNNLDHTALLDGVVVTKGIAYIPDESYTHSRGGGVFNWNSSPAFNNCLFTGNSARFFGGGMYTESGSPLITNCIFSENSVELGGGGMFNKDGSSMVTNCQFNNNSGVTNGGGLVNSTNSTATISHCSFTGNAGRSGGGLTNDTNSSAMISNCIFRENTANNSGGGVFNYVSSNPTITNCVFIGNAANEYGGGLHNDKASSATINCSFSGNTAGNSGGGIGNLGISTPIITNCIIWGNNSGINMVFGSTPIVNYSIVQSGYAGAGTGNLNKNPLFVDQPPVGLGTSGDLHLQSCSPAVNAGTATGAPANDLDGNARPFNGGFDMGAYEFQGVPEPPVAVCKNITVYLNQFGEATFTAAELDNGSTGCGPLSFSTDGQTDAAAYVNCENVGDNTVTLFVTNVFGQTATCTATVTVLDTFPPTIDCAAVNPIRFADPGACSFTVTGGHTGGLNPPHNDFCGADIVNDYNNTQTLNGATFPVGTTPVLWTATDPSGNSASCTVNVTVIDNQSPTADCFDQTLVFNGEEVIALEATDLVETDDNCGIANITLSPAVITCAQSGSVVPVMATVTDFSGNTVTCTNQITVTGLPCGWRQNPDGVNCENGNSIAYNPTTQVFSATSTNCYYANPFTSDELAFAQYELCGNGSITAQVTGISGSALGWAGVVMREDNTAGAKKAQLMTNLNSTMSRREFRTTTGGQAYPQQFLSFNRYWLRLERSGNQFSMSVSPNGQNWYFAGAQNIAMSACIQVGLVVSNYTPNSTVTGTFANVSITGGASSLAGTAATATAGANNYLPQTTQPASQPDFSVFPNPTKGEVTLNLSAYANRMTRIEVYDAQGRMLKTIETDTAETMTERLDLSAYQTGIYLIRVKAEGVPDATKRVVVNGLN
jgi:regulation of enolase protein 1 (concanavalin A-like superfamily)